MLSGKKTYITAALTIIGFWGAYLSGDIGLAAAIEMSVASVLAVTLRHGVSKDPGKSVDKGGSLALLLGLTIFAAGCQTSPGGYERGTPEYDYDVAQETYITVVGDLLALKRSGKISQEEWDETVYPVILDGDELLDAMEAAVLADDPSAANVKLVALRSVIERLKMWVIGEPGASLDGRHGNTTAHTRSFRSRSGHLGPGIFRQADPAAVSRTAKRSAQAAG